MNKIINFIIWPLIAGLIFALTLLQLPLLATWFPGLNNYFPQSQTRQIIQPSAVSYSSAIKRAAPAVVSINSQQDLSRTFVVNKRLYGIIYDENNLGSGVIISPDGYIITSNHIIGATESTHTITLNDGREVEARPVLVDEETDLALLKIDTENLPYISLGGQTNPEVGDVVLAIGNPRNIGQSVSLGIVSALYTLNDSYVIQTDAAINPGNSGGALIDIQGNLIGINSTIVSESGGSEGIGFAVPASKATELLQTYLESGPGGYLGVESSPIEESVGLINYGTSVQGLLVEKVEKDSPAEKFGVEVGDIIIGANDKKFIIEDENSILEAITYISSFGPGATVRLDVFREPEILELIVTLSVGEPIIFNNQTIKID